MTHASIHANGFALITGASSGIGKSYAQQLSRRGYGLVLVARREERLNDLADELRQAHQVDVRTVVADLATAQGRAEVEAVLSSDLDIAVVVNNAGVGALGPVSRIEADALEQLIDVNVLALTRISHAALRHFQSKGVGTLINIGSIIALGSTAGAAAYCGSKAYVLGFTQSLQQEVVDTGIRVQVVMPGPVTTDFFDNAGVSSSIFPATSYISADDLVAASLQGLDAGELVCIPTLAVAQDWQRLLEAQRQVSGQAFSSGRVADRFRPIEACCRPLLRSRAGPRGRP